MRLIICSLLLYSGLVRAMDLTTFLNEVSFVFELSEFEYKSIDSEYEIEAALSVMNKNQEKYLYSFKSSLYSDKDVSEFDGSRYSEVKIDFQQRFERKNIFEKINYTNYAEFAQEKMNGRYTTKYVFDIGPAGLKRNFFKNDTISEFSLEYIPLYSYREYYALNSDSIYDPNSDAVPGKIIEELIKHRINFVIELSLLKTLCSLSNTVSLQRIEALDKRKISKTGNEFENRFEASYQIVDHFDFGYSFDVNTDEIRVQQGLPKTEHVHKINLSYTWN